MSERISICKAKSESLDEIYFHSRNEISDESSRNSSGSNKREQNPVALRAKHLKRDGSEHSWDAGAQKCKCCHSKPRSPSSDPRVARCGLFGKTAFAPGSSQTLCQTSRTRLWPWEGAKIPTRSAWRQLPARSVVSASSRAHFLRDSLDGTFPRAPGNSAAAVGIYFLKAAPSTTSDTRGIHFLGLTATARNSELHLLSAAVSKWPGILTLGIFRTRLPKGCVQFRIIYFFKRGYCDIK